MNKTSEQHKGQHDYTHNFWIGCHKCSEGCKNCYMFVAQNRRRKWGWNTPDPNTVVLVKGGLKTPWPVHRKALRARREDRKYKSVFANSYSDFFLPEADKWRGDAWDLIRQTDRLIWQISTKRPERIAGCLPDDWGEEGYPNVWFGVSVELKKHLPRMDALRKIPCVLRWVDFAPLLEDMTPELSKHIEGIGWVCGAGPEICCNKQNQRPYDAQWARNIRDLCSKNAIPFYSTHF